MMATKIFRAGHQEDTMRTTQETMAAVDTEVIVVAEAEIVAPVDVMIVVVVEVVNPECTTETIMSPEVVLHKEGNTTKVVHQEVIEEAAIKVLDRTTEISLMMKDLNEFTTNMITEEAATEMHPLVHSDQWMIVKFLEEMNLQEKILKGQEVWDAEMAVLVESSEWA
jgi:hypothetical protein